MSAKVEIYEDPLAFKVIRKDTHEVLFDTTEEQFLFSKEYLLIGATISSKKIIGLRPSLDSLEIPDETAFTISLSQRMVEEVANRRIFHQEFMGFHPVYFAQERKSKKYHGVYLRNSHPIDFTKKGDHIKYRMTGGVFDFHFFLGDGTSESCINGYHNYVGSSLIPPLQSFGVSVLDAS